MEEFIINCLFDRVWKMDGMLVRDKYVFDNVLMFLIDDGKYYF